MPIMFWIDVGALSLSTVLACSLTLIAIGFGPRRALNRTFSLFTLLQALWAVASLLLRLALWLERGNPTFLSELATLSIALMGPILLVFATRYLRDTRDPAPFRIVLATHLGLAAVAILAIPLFGHQLIDNPRLDVNGSTTMDLGPWGFAAAVVPLTYMAWTLVLLWRKRHQGIALHLPLSVLVLLVGFVVGGVLEVAFPVLSVTNTLSVAILGYGVIRRQFLNPLRERTAELQRQIAERVQTEEAHSRLATAVDQSAESIVITDTEGTILYVNPAFKRITGYSQDEAIGRTPRILQSGTHDVAFYESLWATISAGEVWQGRFVNKRKDGAPYTEEATISPVRGEDGTIGHYVAVKRDVTAELELESRYRQSQKMEAIGRLAGGVAHDFNNLLTAVQGYTSLLLRELDRDDPLDRVSRQPMRSDLEGIEEAVDRGAALTRQLLVFSRKQVLQPRSMNLNAVLGDMKKMLRRLIGEDIELHSALDPTLGCVKVDPGQMEQVILNLSVNARDAMPTGGKLTFETANVLLDETYAQAHPGIEPGAYVMVALTDTGTGMTKEVQSHLFEPFFTTKEKGKGTGLGLSTVYGIVEQSGGQIQVYSESGVGSTFKVYLPRVQRDTEWVDERRSPAALPRGTEHVLLAEDEEMVRRLAHRILAGQGYTVLAADDPQDALRLCAEHEGQIDLLITDVVMPGMGGRELAGQAVAVRPEMQVLYVSGYPDEAILHHGVLEPGMAFLQKPFTPSLLAAKVRQVLDRPPG